MCIRDRSKEYLDKDRIENIIKRYSDHISIPIYVSDGSEKKDEKIDSVNSASAIWTRPKNKITEEQYKEFYNHAGQMFDDPWMTSHYKASLIMRCHPWIIEHLSCVIIELFILFLSNFIFRSRPNS